MAAMVLAGTLAMLEGNPTSAGAAASGEGWTLAPAPGLDGKAPSSFNLTLDPGRSASGRIVLSNDTSNPLTFSIYPTDATNAPIDGAFALGLPGQQTRGVGRWTTTTVKSLSVPGMHAATFPFTVAVPAGAAPGDYAGGIVALDLVNEPAGNGRVHLNVFNGVGVRIYVRVPGPLHQGLALGRVTATTDLPLLSDVSGSSRALVRFGVSNTGNESLHVTARVHAVDVWGRTVKQFSPIVIPTLLPGSSVTVSEPPWRHLPLAGPVRVEVELASANLLVSGRAEFWVVPWTLLALLVVVLLVAVMVLVRRRRRRRTATGEDEAPVPERPVPVSVPEA